jgi:hypothetical protein
VAKSGDFRGHQRGPQLAITGYFLVATDIWYRHWSNSKHPQPRRRWSTVGLLEECGTPIRDQSDAPGSMD